MGLVQMSTAGAVLILAVIVIRALAMNYLPKLTFMTLWFIVMSRLLLPVSFPCEFSFYTWIGHLAKSSEKVDRNIKTAQNMRTGFSIIENSVDKVTASISVFTVVWLIGFVLLSAYFLVLYVRCQKKFNMSLPVTNVYVINWQNEQKRFKNIKVRISDRILAPLTYGIFRPTILLPKKTDWDDKETLNYILTHEYMHVRHFDSITKIALAMTVCVHWFNPLVWIMYILANHDIELFCDESVVWQFGENAKSTYALTLIRMEEKKRDLTLFYSNFSRNSIEERIEAIMRIRKISIAALMVSICLVGGMTTVFATSPRIKEQDTAPNAYATNKSISSQEREKADLQSKEQTSTAFSIYEKYGLIYHKETDHFYYNGQSVRHFADRLDANGFYNSFFRKDGIVDIFAIRNADYELIGIRLATQEEYDRHTQSIENAQAIDSEGISGNGGIEISPVDVDYVDELLNAYSDFGISYDKNKKYWIFNDKPIYFLSDGDNATYMDNSIYAIENGISIEVIRNEDGQIDELVEIIE